MIMEDAVIIRLNAGSDSIESFEDSYKECYKCLTNYKYYNIGNRKEITYLTKRLDKNQLYYVLAAVYDGNTVTEAFIGCGQFILKKGICRFRLFIKVRSEQNDTVRDILKHADFSGETDIIVKKSKLISEKISAAINKSSSFKSREILIA